MKPWWDAQLLLLVVEGVPNWVSQIIQIRRGTYYGCQGKYYRRSSSRSNCEREDDVFGSLFEMDEMAECDCVTEWMTSWEEKEEVESNMFAEERKVCQRTSNIGQRPIRLYRHYLSQLSCRFCFCITKSYTFSSALFLRIFVANFLSNLSVFYDGELFPSFSIQLNWEEFFVWP